MKKVFFATLVAFLFFAGCSSNSKKNEENGIKESAKQETTTKVQPKVQPKVVAHVAPKQRQQVDKGLTDKANEVVAKATQSAKKSAKKILKKTEELAKQAQNNELVQKVAKKAKAGVAALSSMIPASSVISKKQSPDAKKLFSKCAGCHGNKAQNKALGVSHVIAGWDAKKIENALHGYKAGTYGGAMKAVMQGQASSLSDSDIKALAEYISKLK